MSVFPKLATAALLTLSLSACNETRTSDTADAPLQTKTETASLSSTLAPAGSPNVIFILVDDMGYGQLGVTGSPLIKTPNIDALAQTGTLFTQAYAGSTVCSPSRISLMTGKDAAKLHSNANTILLREDDRTLAHMMQRVGYDTALFGKFGIGTVFGKTDPMTMGFETWVGLLHNITAHRQYPTMIFRDNEMQFVPENVAGAQGRYAQELFTDEAVDYIRARNGDSDPFFMLLSYTSPHAELAAPEEFVDPYRGSYPEVEYTGLSDPENKPKFADYYPRPVDAPNAVQAGMVSALDAYVGRVMEALDAQGLADNTLVFFSSDNGPHEEGGADPIAITASAPYRGGKRDLYDGGIHVPLIANWPAQMAGATVEDEPVAFADILPTLADIVDADAVAMDGLDPNGASILPVMLDPRVTLGERMLYWEFAKQLGDPNSGVTGVVTQAAREGKWKAVRLREDASVELYDILEDTLETNDLAGEFPDVAARFAETFDTILADKAQ